MEVGGGEETPELLRVREKGVGLLCALVHLLIHQCTIETTDISKTVHLQKYLSQ